MAQSLPLSYIQDTEYRPTVQEILGWSFTMWKFEYETFSSSEVHLFKNVWEMASTVQFM
jgi:hypothetical protein